MSLLSERPVIAIVLAAVLLTLPLAHIEGRTYSSDVKVYYDTAELLLEEQAIQTDEPQTGWIHLNGSYYPAMPIGYPLFSLPFVIPTAFLGEPRAVQITDNTGFHRSEDALLGKDYLSDTAAISFHNPRNGTGINISFAARSFLGEKTVTTVFNGERVRVEQVNNSWERINTVVELPPGPSTVQWKVREGCDRTQPYLPESPDVCVGLLVDDIAINPTRLPPVSVAVNDFIWIYEEESQSVAAANPKGSPVRRRLRFSAWSYANGTTLTLETGNRTMSWDVPPEGRSIVTPPLHLPPGRPALTFRASTPQEQCGKAVDGRCLQMLLARLHILSPSRFQSSGITFTGSWYEQEASETRWMGDGGGIAFTTEDESEKTLRMRARSFSDSQTVAVRIGNRTIQTLDIGSSWARHTIPLGAVAGRTTVRLAPSQGCTIPKTTSASEDIRCISIGVRNVRIS